MGVTLSTSLPDTVYARATEFARGFAAGATEQRDHVHRDIDADYTRGFDLGREAFHVAMAKWAADNGGEYARPEKG